MYYDQPKQMLTDEQLARKEALHYANDVLYIQDENGRAKNGDPVDLIAVAQWILDGKDPWPVRVVDQEGTTP
jgi:hypothetical protein